MAKILITSGPTRQYLDPVRYLTNASSGRMGAALATAALRLGHQVSIISGPVAAEYPSAADVLPVTTTDEMLAAAIEHFPACDGVIGAAAPCDYMPRMIHTQKIAKTGEPLIVELIETPDIVATLGERKRSDQWVVGFALETEDRRFRATVKLQRKHCNLIVSNGPEAIDSDQNRIEIIDDAGTVIRAMQGSKDVVADEILSTLDAVLMGAGDAATPPPTGKA